MAKKSAKPRASSPFKIPFLVAKPIAGDRWAYYWAPSATLKKAGWRSLALGTSLDAAIVKANARNEEVARWRAGAAPPPKVHRFLQRTTVAGLIADYKASKKFTDLAASTQRTYASALRLVEDWATDPRKPGGSGNIPAAAITAERVAALRDALMKPDKDGVVHHHNAHGVLRVMRTMFGYAAKQQLIESNPALAFDLAAPPPRHQIWDHDDLEAFRRAAEALEWPNIAFAVELATYTAQREGDILRLNVSQWREINGLSQAEREALANHDGPDAGKVMGLYIRQGKTKRWVGIPIQGDTRRRIEAAIAANAARDVPVMTILTHDRTGHPWSKHQFIDKFSAVRQQAIDDGHAPLADLQFRDLRRTCIVQLGELGLEDALVAAISGHSLASIKQIMEVYMPRNTKMAARAIVARLAAAERAAQEDVGQQPKGAVVGIPT